MKNFSKTIMKIVCVLLVMIGVFYLENKTCPEGLGNAFMLLHANGYIIPKESSVCSFRATVDNVGNGEHWLYGEDNKYYYAGFSGNTGCNNEYLVLKKGKDSENFEKINYIKYMKETKRKWYKNEITMDDLDRSFEYINVEFIKYAIKCNEGKNVK